MCSASLDGGASNEWTHKLFAGPEIELARGRRSGFALLIKRDEEQNWPILSAQSARLQVFSLNGEKIVSLPFGLEAE